MKALCEDFCRHSSLHGVHYLLGTVMERLLWSVLLTVVTGVLVLSVYSMWGDLFKGPVQNIVVDPHYDLNLVEFPALTVCHNSKALKSKTQAIVKAYVKNKENNTAFENSVIALSLMRFPFYNLPQDFVNSINQNVYPIPRENIFQIMHAVKSDLEDVMDHCKWMLISYDCKDLFRRQITEEGFCFSFNSKSAYRPKNDLRNVPPFKMPNGTLVGLRNNMFGRNSGLEFRLKSLPNQWLDKEVVGDSYSCIIHNPAEFPDLSQIMTILPNNPFKLFKISVSANVLEPDESIYKLEESERGCSFTNGTSSRTLCLQNCRDSIILHYCQCIPYYLHSIRREQPVCGMEHLQCLSDINPRLRNTRVPEGIPGFPKWSVSLTMNCSCLPACSYTTYKPEMETVLLNVNGGVEGWTKVKVVHKGYAIKYCRIARYDFRDFVVTCGSMANLLLGFSAVALFDLIVYFFKFIYKGLILLQNTLHNKRISSHLKEKNLNIFVSYKKFVVFKRNTFTGYFGSVENGHFKKNHLIKVLPKNNIGNPIYPFVN